MNFFKSVVKIEKGLTTRAQIGLAGVINGEATIGEALTSNGVKLLKGESIAKAYTNSPYICGAVNAISDYASSVPWRVTQTIDGTKQDAPDQVITKLLRWCNELQTPSEFKAYLTSWLSLYDEVHIAIEKTPREYAEISPISIYVLVPQYVNKVPTGDKKSIKGYSYEVPGLDPIFFKTDEVISIKGFSPGEVGYLGGQSNLNALQTDIMVERYAQRKNANFFKQAATISGILTSESEMDAEEIYRIKEELRTQQESGINNYRILVLTKGMEYTPLNDKGTSVNSDITLIENSRDNHAMVLGVPLALLLGESTDPNIEFLFWSKTLKPMLNKIAEAFTKHFYHKLAKSIDYEVEFDYRQITALMIHDLNNARINVAYINSGILTPNEARARLGFAPHSEDDFGGFKFGAMPIPVFTAEVGKLQTALGSPSLSTTGSEGGRDQSATGEAQMIDTSGKKKLVLPDLFSE